MDDGRRTTHDDGRQPIAIGHPSDSGDLKKESKQKLVAYTGIKGVQGRGGGRIPVIWAPSYIAYVFVVRVESKTDIVNILC